MNSWHISGNLENPISNSFGFPTFLILIHSEKETKFYGEKRYTHKPDKLKLHLNCS